jgi:serine/threonine protein kinase
MQNPPPWQHAPKRQLPDSSPAEKPRTDFNRFPAGGDLFKGRTIKGETGQYAILDKMEKGGTSWVYKAKKFGAPPGSSIVAIKFLREDLNDAMAELGERFKREELIMSRLDHPNIVKLLDFGIDIRMFLVMEYLVGNSLAKDLPASSERLKLHSWGYIKDIILPICDALSYAHGQNVYHRDIKPDNIFLTEQDGKMVPKLLDFGTAKVLFDPAFTTLTKTNLIVGTPYYMPPEAFDPAFSAEKLAERGLASLLARLKVMSDRVLSTNEVIKIAKERINIAKDVYGTGAVLYQLLTGSLPFYEFNPLSPKLKYKIQNDSVMVPSHRVPSMRIPKKLDETVLRALDKDPFSRFSSILHLKSELESVEWNSRSRKLFRGWRARHNLAGLMMKAGVGLALASAGIWTALNFGQVRSTLHSLYDNTVHPWLLQYAPPSELTLPLSHTAPRREELNAGISPEKPRASVQFTDTASSALGSEPRGQAGGSLKAGDSVRTGDSLQPADSVETGNSK